MERRWGMRKSIDVEVVIDNQPACLIRGRIGNVSVGGLFVRTEDSSLAMNSQVELVLMLQQDQGTQVYRLPAMVVRLTPQGAGLMFDEYDVDAFRTLVALLLAKQRAAKQPGETSALPVSIDRGKAAASVKEGVTRETALAAAPVAPVLAQPSPAIGESH